MPLTNPQWTVIAPFVAPIHRLETRGRPRANDRRILEGILWVLRTGAQWKYLPKDYPPYQTCHHRFQGWVRSGAFDRILEALAMDMEYRGRIKLDTCFLDGTFASAKKGVWCWTHEAWERHQHHGYCGRRLSSNRCQCGLCFSARGHLG